MEVQLHSFLTLAPDRGEWSQSFALPLPASRVAKQPLVRIEKEVWTFRSIKCRPGRETKPVVRSVYRLLRHLNYILQWIKVCHVGRTSVAYSVIQKDGLNFVRLYFLNYTLYVNDLHNIWKRRSYIFKHHRKSARLLHIRAAASVESKMATMQHKIFCAQKIFVYKFCCKFVSDWKT